MDSELTIILKMIKQKTGIDIDAFSASKKFSSSTRERSDLRLPSVDKFGEVYSDEALDKTFFSFRFRNANLIGSIDGSGEKERIYAYLIIGLLEGSGDRDENGGRAEQLKSILLGDYSRQQTQKFMHRYSVPDAKCYVLVVSGEDGKTEKVAGFLSRYLSNEYDSVVLSEDMSALLVKFVFSEKDGDPETLASGIAGAIKSEMDITVNIGVSGVVNNLLEVNNAYLQATNALRMSRIMGAKSCVHSYKDYTLVKMLEDVPKFKLSEYLDLLVTPQAKSVFLDADMISTAESFFENDLNVSLAARDLFMHRNTLIYRLDKIHKGTDLDIRKFSDALTFKLIAIMLKILG